MNNYNKSKFEYDVLLNNYKLLLERYGYTDEEVVAYNEGWKEKAVGASLVVTLSLASLPSFANSSKEKEVIRTLGQTMSTVLKKETGEKFKSEYDAAKQFIAFTCDGVVKNNQDLIENLEDLEKNKDFLELIQVTCGEEYADKLVSKLDSKIGEKATEKVLDNIPIKITVKDQDSTVGEKNFSDVLKTNMLNMRESIEKITAKRASDKVKKTLNIKEKVNLDKLENALSNKDVQKEVKEILVDTINFLLLGNFLKKDLKINIDLADGNKEEIFYAINDFLEEDNGESFYKIIELIYDI